LASDPKQNHQYSNVGINDMVSSIPWEENQAEGPVGKYQEVIDVDLSSGIFYPPAHLNDEGLLAELVYGHVRKGSRLGVIGHFQQRSFRSEGSHLDARSYMRSLCFSVNVSSSA
jgi:hypothetical protein